MSKFRKSIKKKYDDKGKPLDNIIYDDKIEYCPNGHQNNLRLDGRKKKDGTTISRQNNLCPVKDCPYSEVST